MQLACSRCGRILAFAGERPLFCSFCGQALSETVQQPSRSFDPEAATVPPEVAAAREAEAVPGQVGGYRLVRALGSGGMGRVYEAEDPATAWRVELPPAGPVPGPDQRPAGRPVPVRLAGVPGVGAGSRPAGALDLPG
jgi:hypothetical protein